MNKGEFIDYIAKQNGSTKAEAERIINTFTFAVISALGEGKDIALIGFGKFHVGKVANRAGRNPRTVETMKLPAYNQPRFSAGKKLKSTCNATKTKKSK